MQLLLKKVGTSGQLTLGKRFAGQHYEVEERVGGELILRPVKVVRTAQTAARSKGSAMPSFQIAEVEQVRIPGREQRNARRG